MQAFYGPESVQVKCRTMKRPVFLLVFLFFFLPNGLHAAGLADSTEFFKNATREDNTPNLDQRLSFLDKAILYSQSRKDLYHELFFLEQKISTNFSFAQYDVQDILDESILKIENALDNCPEEQKADWVRLHIQMLSDRCIVSIMANDYNQCSEILNRIAERYESPYANAKVHMCRGIMSAHKQANPEAVEHFRQAADAFRSIGDEEGVFKATANIGLALLSQGKYEQAISLFLQCHQLALEQHYKADKLICSYQYLAQGYTGMGNYGLANRYYQEAIRLSREHHQTRLLCFTQFYYARNLFLDKQYAQAETEANTALSLFDENGFSLMKAETLNLLQEIYKAQGDYRIAYLYQERFIELIKAFWKEEQGKNLEKLENSLEDYKLRQKIQAMELDKTKMQYRNLLILVLVVISFALIVGIVILYRHFFRQKRISQQAMERIEEIRLQNRERASAIEARFNSEIGSRNKELLTHSLLFLRISNLASSLLEKIKEIKANGSLQAKDKVLLYEMEHLAKEMDPEQDWGEFELYFKETTGDFFSKLSERYPSLSAYEKRVCALFSLGLSNKEIATLMNKSFQSISMAKNRIRKKMGLPTDEEFVEAIRNL